MACVRRNALLAERNASLGVRNASLAARNASRILRAQLEAAFAIDRLARSAGCVRAVQRQRVLSGADARRCLMVA